MLRAVEGIDPEGKVGQAPNKAQALQHEQAGACLALHAAAEARRTSGSLACASGRAAGSAAPADNRSCSRNSAWCQARQLAQAAVEHMEAILCTQQVDSRVRGTCMARLAPVTAELRFLTALQGQHELQASLDRLHEDSWTPEQFTSIAPGALGGCLLSQLLCPELTPSLPDDLRVQPGSRHAGQQLRQLAADSATKPLRDPWCAVHRGFLHLLAATQLQREGDSSWTSHTDFHLIVHMAPYISAGDNAYFL